MMPVAVDKQRGGLRLRGVSIGSRYGKILDGVRRYLFLVKYAVLNDVRFKFADIGVLEGMYERYDDFLPHRGKIVVDVGAQFGDYTLLCNKKYGARVLSLEALPSNFAIVKRQIEKNDVSDGIDAYNFLISSSRYDTVVVGENMAHANEVGITLKDKEKVLSCRLDFFADREDVDLIKIDVEGFEKEVLESGEQFFARHHPRVIIEVHSRDLNSWVASWMDAHGYVLKHEEIGKKDLTFKGMDFTANQYYAPRDVPDSVSKLAALNA